MPLSSFSNACPLCQSPRVVSRNWARKAAGAIGCAAGATGGFVVTSGRFTTDAKDFAQGRNIELVDGPRLFAMIQQARSAQAKPAAAQRETPNSMGSPAPQPQSAVQAPQATAKAVAQPECPRCGAAMALRTARQGANAGNTFWGCTTYPKCWGTAAAS